VNKNTSLYQVVAFYHMLMRKISLAKQRAFKVLDVYILYPVLFTSDIILRQVKLLAEKSMSRVSVEETGGENE
jgi:hypothetical protein